MYLKSNKLCLIIAVVSPLAFVNSTRGQFDVLRRLGRTPQAANNKKIACFQIKGPVPETPTSLPPLFGSEPSASLMSLLDRFKEARRDPDVVAVVVDLQGAHLGLGQIEEIHSALGKFAAIDKEVYVHADSLDTWTYAVSTGASHLSVVPTGVVWLTGIYGETPFLRGTLDKIGIVPDIEQFEEYKTAGETFMRTGPSEASKEMTKWLIDGLYDRLVEVIAQGRSLPGGKVRSLIDGGPYFAEEALKAGLIDSVKHRQDLVAEIVDQFGGEVEFVADYGDKNEFDIPSGDFLALFAFLTKLLTPAEDAYAKPSIGIVYVEGAILTGEEEITPFGSASGAYSTSIRRALDEAADEESVKAVVLRVDSPGGSALASEIILDASKRVASNKPLIVSMGNVAGSGGYYVACAAETIFADPGTITASIGVLGGKFVTTGMWDKLGVNWEPMQRGEMAAMMSSAAPFNDAERSKIRHYMSTVFEKFKQHVVDSRGDRLTKPIGELAGGRVYTGAQALELGLVDKLGGLEDAVKFAAKRAKISEYEIRVIPRPLTLIDLLRGTREGGGFTRASTATRFSFADQPLLRDALVGLSAADPVRARAIVRSLQRLDLIREEGVIMMMPAEFVIH